MEGCREVWKAAVSRVIMARLKWTCQWCKDRVKLLLTYIYVYAPTMKVPPEVKSQFFKQLQDVHDDVPQSDTLVMLGDCNARVGMFNPTDGLWRGVVDNW